MSEEIKRILAAAVSIQGQCLELLETGPTARGLEDLGRVADALEETEEFMSESMNTFDGPDLEIGKYDKKS